MSAGDSIKTNKRTYIRKQILNEGYDRDKFKAYLELLKKDGGDINSWSMREIKTEVENFKRYYSNDLYMKSHDGFSSSEDNPTIKSSKKPESDLQIKTIETKKLGKILNESIQPKILEYMNILL